MNDMQPGIPVSSSAQATVQTFTLPIITPPEKPSRASSLKIVLIIGAVALLSIVGGYGAYAFVTNSWPFTVAQYTEDNLLSGLLGKAEDIQSASYELSGSVNVGPRDSDATPFRVAGPRADLVAEYQRDVTRVRNASYVVEELSYMYGDRRSYDYKTKSYTTVAGKPFPASLSSVTSLSTKIIDPLSKKPYSYTVTNGGKNFELTMPLETAQAAAALRSGYSYVASTTPISGTTATFTKDSGYVSISSSLPRPALAMLADSLKELPPDVSGNASIGAMTSFGNAGSPDWRFNVKAQGDIGDLSYKIDVEARKKDSDYYFVINNFPSVLGALTSYKGQWFKITPKVQATSTSASDYSSYLSTGIAEYEKNYKEQREAFVQGLQHMAALADKDKLLTITKAVRTEKVGDRTLYRYDLALRRESVIQFYQDLMDNELKTKGKNVDFDPGFLEYLKGEEATTVFDYYQKNTWLTLWADAQGHPAKLEYKVRVVPSDDAQQLKDKQINFALSLEIKDINMGKQVEAPANARPTEDIFKGQQ